MTEADFASQKAIHERIHGRFRDHNFLGEEGLAETNSSSPWRWVIDPLDGTSNYVHGFPYYAVNIAAEYRQRADDRGHLRSEPQRVVHRDSGTRRVSRRPSDPADQSDGFE